MASRGKGRGRGRGRGKAKALAVDVEEESGNGVLEDSVPELDVPPPPSISPPVRSSVRLNSTSLGSSLEDEEEEDEEDDVQEVSPVEPMETDAETNQVAKSETKPKDAVKDDKDNTVEANISEKGVEASVQNGEEKPEITVEDAEMVSEDENFVESQEPLDTEAVSDDELKEESQGLPETEAVSDDELPEEKKRKAKVAEAEAVSEDELTDEIDKKPKGEAQEGERITDGGEEGAKKDGKRKLADGEYDPSSPTSEHSGDGSPSAKKAALTDGQSHTPKPASKKPLPEHEKYWKVVKDDPSDFTGWTYLLQYVDQENDVEMAREAYDAFLAHYPYCYGYWRKYADLEKRKGNMEECEKVFDRGVEAIPLSVDLWLHYLNHCKSAKSADKEYIRAQFERALEACGREFRSDRLWESYIKWEKDRKNLINITAIYDRLLAIPTQGYTTHFDTFQDHVQGNPPQTILPVDEFLELRREVVAELKATSKVITTLEDAPPGEEPEEAKDEESGSTASVRMEEETSALRERILAARRKVHKMTVAAVASRWNFEEGIKRPYFHVKPLERCQLKNWKEYLEFEIEQGDHGRIMTLFERCLIACALYEEFWVRFVRYLETVEGDQTEKIREVYERACLIHHKKKPNLHLQWAVFEESAGNLDKAASILENVEATSPHMLQVAYRRINLERRRRNYPRVAELYDEYLASYATNKPVLSNMTVKYARFSWKFLGDIDKAIDILERALEKDKDNTRLYLQLIDMGLQKDPVDEDRIVTILDQFLDKEGDLEQKLMFAQRKIEFLEDFGTSVERIQRAQDDFQKYIKQVKDKKKKMETPELPAVAPPVSKKPKVEPTPPTSSAPLPSAPPPSAAPPTNYPPTGYPPYNYGQYPPPSGDQSNYQSNYPSGYNNYSNWNNYPQGNYGNYPQQSGWPGYYPTNY